MPKWLEDHSLSLSFFTLFVAAVAGQSITGHYSYNAVLSVHGLPAISYVSYLGTGNFLDSAFTNWQAAFLQLGCLIVFSEVLRERGAAHSLRPIRNVRKKRRGDGKHRPWIYRNSLSLALIVLFGLSFIAHLFFSAKDYNATLGMIHMPPISIEAYAVSSAFWFSVMQTWEAEFIAIAIYIFLSIYLRQQGSPESKPVESSDRTTGETNH